MLKIKVSESRNIDSAIKALRYKYNKVGIRKDLIDKKQFTKKSVKRREEKRKAIYVQHLRDSDEA